MPIQPEKSDEKEKKEEKLEWQLQSFFVTSKRNKNVQNLLKYTGIIKDIPVLMSSFILKTIAVCIVYNLLHLFSMMKNFRV